MNLLIEDDLDAVAEFYEMDGGLPEWEGQCEICGRNLVHTKTGDMCLTYDQHMYLLNEIIRRRKEWIRASKPISI